MMEHGKTGPTARRLAILLLPAIIVVVGVLAFRAGPSSGQAGPEREAPSGPAAEVGPPPSVGEAQRISGDTALAFGIPSAEPEEVVQAAMQQAAPRGETPIDPVDGLAAEPADTGFQQEDLAVSSGEEPSAGVLQRNFPGVTYTGWIPPDDQIAAGPDHLVIPLNGAVAYFDKGGNNLYQTTLTGFFGSLADPVSSVFDPRIIWDHDSGRFILVAVGRNTTTNVSFYFMAVSATSNPLDGWCRGSLDAQFGDPNVWADYPDVGVGPNDGLYITSNQFTWAGAFAGAQLLTIDKSGLTGCTNIGGWRNGGFTDGDGGASFTLRPAVDRHSHRQAEWVVNSNSANANWLTIWRVINNMPFAPTITGQTLTVNSYQTPPDARQPGGVQALDNIGTRLLNTVSHNDYVWTVGTTECNRGGGPTESCLRWYQLDLWGWPTMTINHQGEFGLTNLDYFYPGITANNTNDVVISFARSGTGEYAQARHTARLAGDPANWLQASALLKAGEASYLRLDSVGRNRWGDYAGVSYGANDEFWILHQYADNPYSPPGNPGHWDTWVGCIGLDESQCAALTPTPTPSPTPVPPPNRFYGDVTLNASPAPPGTSLGGEIGGTACGSTTVQPDSSYVLDVPSAGAVPGCGVPGATVNFRVAGYLANETGTWTSGAFTPLDLSAGATPTPTPTETNTPTPTNTPVTPTNTPTPKPEVKAECTHWTIIGKPTEFRLICHLSDEKFHGRIYDWEIMLEEQSPVWPKPEDWECTAEKGVIPWTPNDDIAPNPKCKDEVGDNPWLVSQCRDMHVLFPGGVEVGEKVEIHLTDFKQGNIGIMRSVESPLPPEPCQPTPTPTKTNTPTPTDTPVTPTDTPTVTATPFACTPPFTSIVAGDTDCDGAPDVDELGAIATQCGTRDPNNPWDFYNVPAPSIANGGNMTATRDSAVSIINDVLGVLEYSGTALPPFAPCNSGPDGIPGNADDRCYDDDLDSDTVNDGVAYDRSAAGALSGPPNGAINILEDVLAVLAQSGHGPCPSA